MNKQTIVVLFGGYSSEYNVSLQSAASILSALDTTTNTILMLGITKEGEWLLFPGEIAEIEQDTWWQNKGCKPAILSPSRSIHGLLISEQDTTYEQYVDVVFPVLHGKHGEDGTVQGLLELAGIPYVGCGVLSSAICMDKDIAHILAKEAGIPVPDYVVLRDYMKAEERDTLLAEVTYPAFVKPAKAGSSFGITRITCRDELDAAVMAAFTHDDKVVIEESIDGFEVGCAVLGNTSLIIGAVDEIELQSNIFDFHEKYTLETSAIHVPARITPEQTKRIKECAMILYRALECSGLARVDMFLTPSGDIVFNEINTLPGFTSHSRYPNMMKEIGFAFEDILSQALVLAVEHSSNK